MIISFYNEKFVGLQNNASLVVDNPSYSLVRRGVELDELKSGRKVPHTVDNYDKLLRTFGYS